MLISVVIPTHNRPEMLAEALASVRAQTFTDYELIVVSNGEGPDTGALSQAFAHDAATYHHSLTRLVSRVPPLGRAAAELAAIPSMAAPADAAQ